jgi:hypothetical protein
MNNLKKYWVMINLYGLEPEEHCAYYYSKNLEELVKTLEKEYPEEIESLEIQKQN